MRREELEKRIAALPEGYLSRKMIRGKENWYYQWREDGKLKSKYVSYSDVDSLREQIQERHRLKEELKFLSTTGSRLEAYARSFYMSRKIAIGIQNFERLISHRLFYIDKTDFIRKWWDNEDIVTMITRPRRFGKTLTLSMVECFFSTHYADRADLFQGLSVWKSEIFREMQGKWPVINLSFSSIKGKEHLMDGFAQIIREAYHQHPELLSSDKLMPEDKEIYMKSYAFTGESYLAPALYNLCRLLNLHYGKKVIILLDEYDTPLQEAWLYGCWDETVTFIRELFNYTFKTNPYLERGLITGITKVSKNSVFSDMNNIRTITTSSQAYETDFGFTEQEVYEALEEQGLGSNEWKQKVKAWYDGFTFGKQADIYNPWSITCFLKERQLRSWWVNSSDNAMVSELLRNGDIHLKQNLQALVLGESIIVPLQEEIVFEQLQDNEDSVWNFLISCGYLRIVNEDSDSNGSYKVTVTNHEVELMLADQIKGWFQKSGRSYENFIAYLMKHDLEGMNYYMNKIAFSTFSYFDTSGSEPERFYHGFVLGMIIELRDRYEIRSNRESGLGRYDIMLIPRNPEKHDPAYILEFKVMNPAKETSLAQTASNALNQILERNYMAELLDRGYSPQQIYSYGIAFSGKQVLIEAAE